MDLEEKKGIDATFFLDKPVVLIVYDKDRVVRRDGILKGIDHTHYHLLITIKPHKGKVCGFLRSDVKRIELAGSNQNQRGDCNH